MNRNIPRTMEVTREAMASAGNDPAAAIVRALNRSRLLVDPECTYGVVPHRTAAGRQGDVRHPGDARQDGRQGWQDRMTNQIPLQAAAGTPTCIIRLGDHDPSGVDMTWDIEDRMALFGADVTVQRIALNMDQVQEHNPPPNPARLTDSRASGYIREHGRSGWELDALDPTMLDQLIEDEIWAWGDADLRDRETRVMERERTLPRGVADRWDEVSAPVGGDGR
ncbi:hypothetical protein [Streptomyces shenzhenensis]|uniref:hypothetical protein n=2 Tax=Streptomyces TaxID=1883 RepID=UPI0033D92486